MTLSTVSAPHESRGRAAPGLGRIEAWFAGGAYDPHRHDAYAIGYTMEGVQSFDCRGARDYRGARGLRRLSRALARAAGRLEAIQSLIVKRIPPMVPEWSSSRS